MGLSGYHIGIRRIWMTNSPIIWLCLMIYLWNSFLVCDANIRFPSRKTWWVKQVTEDVYTSGRPTVMQIKLASEAGFKSIISVFNFTTQGALAEEVIPTTDQAIDVATRLSGLEYGVLYSEKDFGEVDWASLGSVQKFSVLYSKLPKPILVHCSTSYKSTFISLLYFANVTRHDSNAVPKIDKKEFYLRTNIIGHDYAKEEKQATLVSEITGEDDETVPPTKPDVSLPDWNKHSWIVKPLYKNIYVAGQIQSNQLTQFDSTGFEVLVNNRKGVTTPPNDTPTQEEAILLNIKDRTGTYTGSGRQSKEHLLKNRVDPSKPNEYISPTSLVNYQSRNPLQFGDNIGYNETWEREYIKENWSVEYIHQPIGGQYKYGVPLWEAYKEQWEELGNRENVNILIHCRTGYRSSVIGYLAIGHVYCKSSEWVLDRARRMGYHFEVGKEDDVIDLFKAVLDQERPECDTTGSGSTALYTYPVVMLIFFISATMAAFMYTTL